MKNYISSYTSIKERCIKENGAVIFKGKDNEVLTDTLISAYEFLQINYPKFYKMDNLSKLGFLAGEVVLKGRTITRDYPDEQVAVILSNASSSLDTDKHYWESTRNIASPGLFVYTLPNIVIGEICIRHGLKGENGFFIFEEFDADFMVRYTDQVLASGSQACIAGWMEAVGEEYEAFLYLIEKQNRGVAIEHTIANIEKLYKQNYGTIDSRS